MNYHYTFGKNLGPPASSHYSDILGDTLLDTDHSSQARDAQHNHASKLSKKSFIKVTIPNNAGHSSKHRKVNVVGSHESSIKDGHKNKQDVNNRGICGCLDYFKGEETVDFGFTQKPQRRVSRFQKVEPDKVETPVNELTALEEASSSKLLHTTGEKNRAY